MDCTASWMLRSYAAIQQQQRNAIQSSEGMNRPVNLHSHTVEAPIIVEEQEPELERSSTFTRNLSITSNPEEMFTRRHSSAHHHTRNTTITLIQCDNNELSG